MNENISPLGYCIYLHWNINGVSEKPDWQMHGNHKIYLYKETAELALRDIKKAYSPNYVDDYRIVPVYSREALILERMLIE